MKKFAIIVLTVIAGIATANFALGQDQDKAASLRIREYRGESAMVETQLRRESCLRWPSK